MKFLQVIIFSFIFITLVSNAEMKYYSFQGTVISISEYYNYTNFNEVPNSSIKVSDTISGGFSYDNDQTGIGNLPDYSNDTRRYSADIVVKHENSNFTFNNINLDVNPNPYGGITLEQESMGDAELGGINIETINLYFSWADNNSLGNGIPTTMDPTNHVPNTLNMTTDQEHSTTYGPAPINLMAEFTFQEVTEEYYNTTIQIQDSDNDGIADSLDAFPSMTTQDVVNEIKNNPSVYNLYSIEDIQDLRPGSTMIEIHNGQATLTMEVEQSDDLSIWTNGGASTLEIPLGTEVDKKFFRFKMNHSDSSNKDINLSIGDNEYDEAAIIEALAEQYGVPASFISLSVTGG